MNSRMMWMALLALIVGCSGNEGPGKGALDCGEGSRLELETTDVCVYRDPLLVETGFDCPAEAQYGSSYGDLTVCSPQEMLPGDFFDEVAEQYPDDVPTGDCMAVVCDLGQTCVEGTCGGEPPDNNDEFAPELVLNATSIDFGDVSEFPGSATRLLTVINAGDADLELTDIAVDLPFTHDAGESLTIEPGDQWQFAVTIVNDGTREEGIVTGALTFATNDAATPDVSVALTANLVFGEPLCGDMFEPNETAAEATAATPGTEYNAVLCMQDEDWWSFEVTEVTDQTLELTSPTDLAGVEATLYQFLDGELWQTSFGRELQGSTDTLTATLLVPGEYAWRITAPPTPVAYALTLTNAVAMCTSDANESNDTMVTATRSIEDADIGSGYLFGSLCGGDVDYYVLQDPSAITLETMEVGRLIEVAITSFWGESPPITLHGPGGPVSATSSTAAGGNWTWEQLTYEVDAEGTYHVEVNAPANDVYQYRLGALVRPSSTCDADLNEPNDAAIAATPLSPLPGQLLQVPDLHLCDGDEDWFVFDLADDQSVMVNLSHSTTASFRVELFKEGESVPRAVDVEVPTSTDELTYTAPPGDGGRYLARVSNQVPGSSARHYLLNVILN